MAEKKEQKVKRPVSEIIEEKIGWLEKRVRDENNDRLTKFPSEKDRAESNKRFGRATDNLRGIKNYLFGDPPEVVEQSHLDPEAER